MEAAIFWFVVAPCGLLIALVVLAVLLGRDRAERIEEAMEYDPKPLRDGRFATPDELRKRGW
jgi:hypothetical protein